MWNKQKIALDIDTIKSQLSYLKRSPDLVAKLDEIKDSLNSDAPKMLGIDIDLFKLDVLSKIGEFEAAAELAEELYSSYPREFYPSERRYGDTMYQIVESLAKTDNLGIAYKIINKLHESNHTKPSTYLSFVLDKSLIEVSIEISDYERALKLTLEVINNPKYNSISDIQNWRPTAINEIAYLYNQLGDGERALTYLEEAAKIIETQNWTERKLNKARALNFANRGRAYLLNADYEKSKEMGVKLLIASEVLNEAYLKAVSHRLIGISEYHQGQFNKAREELEAGIKIAESDNQIGLKRNLYKDYAHTLEKLGRNADAIIWYKKLLVLESNRKNSIVSTQGIIKEMELDALKAHQEVVKLQNAAERNKIVGKLMLVTIILLLAGGIILTYHLFYAHKSQNDLLKSEKKAQSANQAKSDFLANMSHEIRTPMNGVFGILQLLERTQLTTQQKQYLDIMAESGKILLALINDILDFSKIEAGKLYLSLKPTNLDDSLKEVVSLLLPKAKDKGIELSYDYSSDLPLSYLLDKNRVRQIVLNLVGNALKFTPSGHVNIRVYGQTINSEAQINICISDTGVGIEPDKLRVIFEKFTQSDNSTKDSIAGAGLGLAIALRLTEAMQGQLSVESTAGVGSAFTIRLPLKIVSPTPIIQNPAKNTYPALAA